MNASRQRRSVRLSSYDYAQVGAYFVTICTQSRQLFFERDAVRAIAERCWLEIPDHFPRVVLDEWVVMPNHIHGIIVLTDPNDEPNASHGRGVQLNAPTPNTIDGNVNRRRIGDDGVDPHRTDDAFNASHGRGVQLNAPTPNTIDSQRNISDMQCRSMQTPRNPTNPYSVISPHRDTLAVIVRTYKAAVTTFCRREGYTYFQWQRNYYERVIRDDSELNRTRQYIIDNPPNWNQDEHNAR